MSLESVEDEVEPELELGLVVAPSQSRIRVVVCDVRQHADEVWQLWGKRFERGVAGLPGLVAFIGLEQLLAEPECSASEGMHRMVPLVVRESTLDQDPQ